MGEKKRIRITIIAVLLLLVGAFIFYMSSRDVEQSLDNSIPFDRILASIFVDGYDEMGPDEQYLAALQFDELSRHAAHITEFAVLGTLLAAICLLLSVPVWAGILVGIGYGVFDEVHQIFVNGRGFQVSDIGFDILGVLIGGVLVMVLRKLRQKGN